MAERRQKSSNFHSFETEDCWWSHVFHSHHCYTQNGNFIIISSQYYRIHDCLSNGTGSYQNVCAIWNEHGKYINIRSAILIDWWIPDNYGLYIMYIHVNEIHMSGGKSDVFLHIFQYIRHINNSNSKIFLETIEEFISFVHCWNVKRWGIFLFFGSNAVSL